MSADPQAPSGGIEVDTSPSLPSEEGDRPRLPPERIEDVLTGLLDLSPGPIVSSFWEQLARARDARSALLACMRVSRALRDIARPLFASLLVCDSMTVAFRVLYRDLSAVRTLVIYDLRHGQKADVLRACPFITTLATSAWPAVSLPISCRQIAVGNVHARDDAWVRLPTGLTRFALGHVERAYLDVPFVNLRSVTLNEEALVIFRSCKSLVNLHSLRLQEHRRPLDAFKIIAFSSIVRLYIDWPLDPIGEEDWIMLPQTVQAVHLKFVDVPTWNDAMKSRRPPIRKPSPLLEVASDSVDALARSTLADDARVLLEGPEGSSVLAALRERVHVLEERLGASVVLIPYEGVRGGEAVDELVPAQAAPNYTSSYSGYRSRYDYDSEREYDSYDDSEDDY